MKGNIHSNFILTPIYELLKESVNVCLCVAKGIESQPLSEYIMQTTFLKMTGASEQKLKCICWEMATYDYDYRYNILTKPLGECSCYNEKKSVFNDILSVIKNMNNNYNFDDLFCDDKKNEICETTNNNIISIVSNSPIEIWENRAFLFYKKNKSKYTDISLFANRLRDDKSKTPYSFLENDLKVYYDNVVYRHRNRCAHNLKSYQNNLPTLNSLVKNDYDYENYFHMFSVLILLDQIYMTIYKEYLSILNNLVI